MGASRGSSWPATNKKVMNHLAEMIGHDLADSVTAGPLRDVVAQISRFWRVNDLGEMHGRAEGHEVEINDCYDCTWWRLGLAALPCSFKATLIRVASTDLLTEEVRLTETACCRRGGNSCTFRLRGSTEPPRVRAHS